MGKRGKVSVKHIFLFSLVAILFYTIFVLATGTGTQDINVELFSPSDGAYDNDGTINFTCNATMVAGEENTSFVNLSLMFNLTGGTWGVNQTNDTAIYGMFLNGSAYNFTITGLDDGIYTWACIAYHNSSETDSNYNQSVNRTLTVDQTPPTVNSLNTLVDDTNSSTDNIAFEFTATDTNADVAVLYLNGVSNETVVSYTSGVSDTFSSIHLDDGYYNWTVLVNDSAGNTDWYESNYTITVDTAAPTGITLNNPSQNDTNSSDDTIAFAFTATDTGPFYAVLYINGQLNETIKYWISGSSNSFSSIHLDDGIYNWTVFVNDTTEHSAWYTDNFTLTVDTANPTVTYQSPTPSSSALTLNNSVTVNVTISDANPVHICLVDFMGTNYSMTEESTSSYYWTNATTDGDSYSFQVMCNDSAGNWGTETQRTFTENSLPTVTILYPSDSTYYNTAGGNLHINYSCTDAENLAPCTFYTFVNDTLNTTQATNVTSITFDDGNYTLTVMANDGFENGTNATNISFIVDTTNPIVDLIFPTNNYNSTTKTITFNYTATDANIQSCTLYSNFSGAWQANETNSSADSGAWDIFIKTIPDGNYIWNVWCNDSAGNSAFNETNLTFNIDTPPTVTITTPSTGANTISTFQPNITVSSDSNNCSYFLNSTSNNVTMTLTGTMCLGNLTDFVNGTNYTITFYSWDAIGNLNDSENKVFYIDDIIPPGINSVESSGVTTTVVTITWTTTEYANATVGYGITTALGSTASDTSYDQKSQSISLSGLSAGTTYYYNATSCDYNGNCNSSALGTFTTTAAATTPSSSGGGGGGVSGPIVTTVDLEINQDFTSKNGVTFQYAKGSKFKFTSSKNSKHTITITTVYDDSVLLTINSETTELNIKVGETKEVDVDKDGFKDIKVTLERIYFGKAELNFKKLATTTAEPTVEKQTTTEGVQQEEPLLEEELPTEEFEEEIVPTKKKVPWDIIIVVFVIIVLVAVIFVIMRHRKTEEF